MTAGLLDELVGLLRAVTGEDAGWAAGVRAGSRLDGDLLLDSVELAALSLLVHQRYGADLAGFVAGLDIDRLIDLTVGDVVAYVAAGGGRP